MFCCYFFPPSLSLSLLTGPLKYGVCVCCFVLFVLSGCYVVISDGSSGVINKRRYFFQ